MSMALITIIIRLLVQNNHLYSELKIKMSWPSRSLKPKRSYFAIWCSGLLVDNSRGSVAGFPLSLRGHSTVAFIKGVIKLI